MLTNKKLGNFEWKNSKVHKNSLHKKFVNFIRQKLKKERYFVKKKKKDES